MSSLPSCPLCASPVSIFGKKNEFTLYKCGACSLVFVYPIPDSSGVYTEDYFTGASAGFGYVDYDADKEPMVPTFNKYVQLIRPLAKGKKLLDVGAATGFFLEIAKQSEFDIYGVEISAYAAQCARDKGIRMITGTLVDVPAAPLFDVITMLDVIEHVGDPCAELVRARALLEKEGLLVLNTPDVGSLYARIMGQKWHLIVPPEHLFYFNHQTMRSLLEKSGFEVISISTVGKRFTLSYIFNMLHLWQKFVLWKHISNFIESTWLNRISIPINLRDNMFVIARKV